MGIRIVAGRAIDQRDVNGRELAVVINETMARRYWPGREALRGVVEFGSGPARVVGIARDGKYSRLNEAPANYMYLSIYQYYRPDVLLVARTSGDPAAVFPVVRNELKRLDPNLPLFDMRTASEHLELSVFIPRLASTMLALFGGLALLLASVGLYSVIAFNAHEIGVRIALGARRSDVLRLVARPGLIVTAIGSAIGLLLAFVAARLIAGQLMVPPGDPVSFAVTLAVLFIVATAASILPARRAAAMDPVKAMRQG